MTGRQPLQQPQPPRPSPLPSPSQLPQPLRLQLPPLPLPLRCGLRHLAPPLPLRQPLLAGAARPPHAVANKLLYRACVLSKEAAKQQRCDHQLDAWVLLGACYSGMGAWYANHRSRQAQSRLTCVRS